MLSTIFHVVLYQPIFNIFVSLYNLVPGHDLGVVILLMTVLLRLVLYPFTSASIKAQRSMQELQPKMDAIKAKYATDKQAQAQAVMELYKTHKVNPLTSCLPILIQLPILIALFWVLRDGLASHNLEQNLYSFVQNPGTLNPIAFGFLNLTKANWILAVLAGLAQYFQAKTMSRKMPPKEAGEGALDESMTAMMNKQMLYFMPAMTILIGLQFAAGLTLYWFFSTVLMILQQFIVRREPATATSSDIVEGTIVEKK